MPKYSKRNLILKLGELGIALDKRRGQCYLIDHNIINSIIHFADLDPEEDTVLEVGAGMGILSDQLIANSKQAFLIENDRKIGEFLASYYSSSQPTLVLGENDYNSRTVDTLSSGKHVVLILADALKIQFPKVSKIVANIPYQISAPLIFKLIEEWDYDRVILMVQKEFARRMVGKVNSKDYSRLSAAVGLFLDIAELKNVPPTCFFPQPRVHSTIIELRQRVDTIDKDLKERWRKSYLALLRGVFPYKNRTLRNAIKLYFKNEPHAKEKMHFLNNGLENPETNHTLEQILGRKVRSIAPTQYFFLMLYGLLGEPEYLSQIFADDQNEA